MEEEFDFEEQDSEDGGIDNERHWKSLSIASAVISVICTIIIVAIILLTPANGDGKDLQPYSLDEVINRQMIKGHHFNGTWISEHEFIYQSADKNIILYDCENGIHHPITNKLNISNRQVVAFRMSPSRSFLLITMRMTEQSSSSNYKYHLDGLVNDDSPPEYFLYDLRNGNILNLNEELCLRMEKYNKSKNEKQDMIGLTRSGNSGSRQQHRIGSQQIRPIHCTIQGIEWSTYNNELTMAVANDIYRLSVDKTTMNIERLTTDGSIESGIYNGLNDQLYREFIIGKETSIWWYNNSESHHYLAYLKLNNTIVPTSTITVYPSEWDQIEQRFHYPILNGPIGDASVWVIHLENEKMMPHRTIRIEGPFKGDTLIEREHYVTYVDWTPDGQLLVIWTSRNQRRSVVGLCSSIDNWTCKKLATLSNWRPLKHIMGSIIPVSNQQPDSSSATQTSSNDYLVCCQVPENGDKTSHQLYSLNTKTKVITSYLNMGDYGDENLQYHKVFQLLSFNAQLNLVFFVGQSLSRIGDETIVNEQDMRPNIFVLSRTYRTVQCLSCRLVTCQRIKNSKSTLSCLDARNGSISASVDTDDDSCLFQSAHFGPQARYAIITCLTGIVPRVYLVEFTHQSITPNSVFHNSDLVQNVTLFDDNAEMEQRIESKIIPNVESFIISREYESTIKYLRIKILTPLGFDNEHLAKYPLMFQLGPASFSKSSHGAKGESRTEEYPDADWAIHMVTKHNCVFAWLDGHLWDDGNHANSENSFEELVDDYSSVIEFVQSNMTFVKFEHSCLIGTNVGASLVLVALSTITSSFRCGIAIAPIVHWQSINTLIVEQYLDRNRLESTDLSYLLKINLNHSELNNKRLLVAHGTSNQLVPFVQTMQLVNSLTMAEVKQQWKIRSDNPQTSPHMIVPLVNQGNSFGSMTEYLYKKIELFIFKFVIVNQ